MAKKIKEGRSSPKDHYPKRHGNPTPVPVVVTDECTHKGKKCQNIGKKTTCSRTGHLCEVV